jgi:hypothetical protein
MEETEPVMLEDTEVAEYLRDLFGSVDEGTEETIEMRGAESEGLPSENAGFEIRLLDGTRFTVVVTKIEEGE